MLFWHLEMFGVPSKISSTICHTLHVCYILYHRSNSNSVSAWDTPQTHSWSSNITSCTLPFSIPPAPYHMPNHHYPILQHFTCQQTPSNTCIITQHLGLQLHMEQIPYVQFPLPHIYFTSPYAHFTLPCVFLYLIFFPSCAHCHLTNHYVSALLI